MDRQEDVHFTRCAGTKKKKRYELSINGLWYTGFQSAEGVPVKPTSCTFFTTDAPEIEKVEQTAETTTVFFRDYDQWYYATIFFHGDPFFNSLRSPAIVGDKREQYWKADLTWLRNTLPSRHKNLFFKISRAEFLNRMDALIGSIPDSDDRTLKAELIKIINAVGDSHTSVSFPGITLPVTFFIFEEGVFVDRIDARFPEYYGRKLTAVEGIPIEHVLERLQPFIHHDNASYEKNALAGALRSVERLYLAGIAGSETRIRYTFGDVDWVISHKDLAGRGAQEWLPKPEQSLLSQKNWDKNYWFQRLDGDVLYVKYNLCSIMKDYSVAAFMEDVFKERNVRRMIVDLRDNVGGSSPLFAPFIAKMGKHPTLNTPENFKVIVGRKTFSSAMLNALELKAQTNAAFIGEPTGSGVNHYGEVRRLVLSNIEGFLGYSTKYFKRSPNDDDALYPDISVPLRAEEWFGGEDAFLEAALR